MSFSASARGATYLILIQVGSRAASFSINQVLLRFMSPALLGASTQLELYSISILFFARESLRVALQRHSGNLQATVNLAYTTVLLGLPLSLVLGWLYAKSSLPSFSFAVAAVLREGQGRIGHGSVVDFGLIFPYVALIIRS